MEVKIISSMNIIFRIKSKENKAVAWDSLILAVYSQNLELSLKKNLRKLRQLNRDQVIRKHSMNQIFSVWMNRIIKNNSSSNSKLTIIRISNSKAI